jgi:protein TonB
MEDENDAIIEVPPRTKLGVAVVVLLFHAVAILALIRAFAPDLTARAVETVVSTFTVTVTTPPPPEPAKEIEKAGAAGDQGKKAVAREVKAEKPRVAIAKTPAPKAASSGNADTSGAREAGSGTGAGGSGSGTGSGSGGSGSGGGMVSKAVHVSGQINNARDFPVPPGGREARVGKSVILALTVNTDGRATGCRIYRSSGLPETDDITCRLAKERLRFRPATNSLGEPIVSTFYWQQKFFF